MIREDYLKIIEEIRNLETGALDDYIAKKLIPLKNNESFFVETLYKDICYVLRGVDSVGDNDLIIENGDFVFESGDFKLTGYQTRLHDLCIWLHAQIIEKAINEGAAWNISERMQQFESIVLKKNNYTPEYKRKLDAINRSIKRERFENYKKPNAVVRSFIRFWDFLKRNTKIKIPFAEINLRNDEKN